VHYKVHVQRTSASCWDGGLDRVVHSAPSINCCARDNTGSFQDAERVAIDWEHVTPEAIEKNTTGPFPRQTRQARQEPLGFLIAHSSQ
jgi:hypothetical protein